ncbi:MAG: ABC transporter ATP-binding protein [Sporolactobacillus sp.]
MSGNILIDHIQRDRMNTSGKKIHVLEDINLDIAEGEFVAFIGPSGCGKTTLLRLIAGLDTSQGGNVIVDGQSVEGPDYSRGYVFQQASLFPWETIRENIATGLKARKIYKEQKDQVQRFIDLTGLTGFEDAYPHQISGGMVQRAALARTLINHPKLLLLDEPMGALDAFTRMAIQQKISEIWQKNKTTMILVTHDIDEAIFLSTRIAIMTPLPGKIKKVVAVDLPFPRDRTSDAFFALRKEIYSQLKFS